MQDKEFVKQLLEPNERPLLSVVVIVTSGISHLGRCLQALESQLNPPSMEIIVPFDSSVLEIKELYNIHKSVRFVDMGLNVHTEYKSDPGIAHLMYDRRRAAGIAAARANIIAMTEDHAVPDKRWCANITAVHQKPYGVIGGAIDNATDGILNWAVYFCDFARYQNPVKEGSVKYISDVNVSYKRAVINKALETWQGSYHETAIHNTLLANGETLWLTSDLIVRQERGRLKLADVIRERFAWGRLYAGKRVNEVRGIYRLPLIIFSLLLPPLLVWRKILTTYRRGRYMRPLIRVFPIMVFLVVIWTLGELIGYLTGKPTARRIG